jgi:hypothetical protein
MLYIASGWQICGTAINRVGAGRGEGAGGISAKIGARGHPTVISRRRDAAPAIKQA